MQSGWQAANLRTHHRLQQQMQQQQEPCQQVQEEEQQEVKQLQLQQIILQNPRSQEQQGNGKDHQQRQQEQEQEVEQQQQQQWRPQITVHLLSAEDGYTPILAAATAVTSAATTSIYAAAAAAFGTPTEASCREHCGRGRTGESGLQCQAAAAAAAGREAGFQSNSMVNGSSIAFVGCESGCNSIWVRNGSSSSTTSSSGSQVGGSGNTVWGVGGSAASREAADQQQQSPPAAAAAAFPNGRIYEDLCNGGGGAAAARQATESGDVAWRRSACPTPAAAAAVAGRDGITRHSKAGTADAPQLVSSSGSSSKVWLQGRSPCDCGNCSTPGVGVEVKLVANAQALSLPAVASNAAAAAGGGGVLLMASGNSSSSNGHSSNSSGSGDRSSNDTSNGHSSSGSSAGGGSSSRGGAGSGWSKASLSSTVELGAPLLSTTCSLLHGSSKSSGSSSDQQASPATAPFNPAEGSAGLSQSTSSTSSSSRAQETVNGGPSYQSSSGSSSRQAGTGNHVTGGNAKLSSHWGGVDLFAEMAAAVGPGVLVEPELLVVVGPVLCLAGYPPFHARSCEIFHLESAAEVDRGTLARVLGQYCRVLQRHGS